MLVSMASLRCQIVNHLFAERLCNKQIFCLDNMSGREAVLLFALFCKIILYVIASSRKSCEFKHCRVDLINFIFGDDWAAL